MHYQSKISENAKVVLEKRYLAKDERGKVIETIPGMFERVASGVAMAEFKYVEDREVGQKNYEEAYDIFYKMMTDLDFLPNSPTLMNAGRPLGQLSACFVLPVGDSMEEIFDTVKNAALIHKSGGGTGFSFSRLRPCGSSVRSTGGVASGPVSFMKVFNAATEAVKQGGCFRGDTLIATSKGPVQIKDLKAGDMVYSWDPDKGMILTPCTDPWMTKKDAEVWELSTDKGLHIIATPDHPFLPSDAKSIVKAAYIKLQDLKPGTTLMPLHGNTICTVVSSELYGSCDVWNVEIPGTHNYVVCNATMENGVVVSNTRRGANMGILRVDHPDILEFIDCKNNTHENNNFNISVAITDVFMDALKNDTTYQLIDPHTNKAVGELRAKDVFERITQSAWRTGEPGVVFIDRINEKSPLKKLGMIESTNPCGEQPLLPYEACNLGSINLLNHVDITCDEEHTCFFDFKKLERTVTNAVRFLDDVIDVNNYPLPEIDQMTRATRKIGLGVMGFADTLLMLDIPYNSEEGIDFAKRVMSCIENAAWAESRRLAKIRGPFPAIGQSDFVSYERENVVRNATVTTIAPTGTISMIAGVSSGIEPIFAYAYIRNIMDNTQMVETNAILSDYLDETFDPETADRIKRRIADEGTIAHIEEIPIHIRKIFVSAHDIDPISHVRMQDAFQRFTDNAVSKTINFPNSATLQDVQTAYRMAYYDTSCKGITVYRDGSRENQVLNIKAVNEEKKGAATDVAVADVSNSTTANINTDPIIQPRDRGEELDGFTRKVTIGCGKLYITINHDEKGICEVFTNNGKGGGCPSQSEATARLASIALRAGISTDAIIEQLKGIRCPSCQRNGNVKVLSCPDAIGRLLEEAAARIEQIAPKDTTAKNPAPKLPKEATESYQKAPISDGSEEVDAKFARNCPECGATLEHEGGCVICRSCGYSKCG